MFDEYKTRSRLIKRIIFWSVVVGAILAFMFSPLNVKSVVAQTPSNNSQIHGLEYQIPKIQEDPKPLNTCDAIGGCVWEIDRYNQGSTLDRAVLIIFDIIFIAIFLAGLIAVIMIIYGAVFILTAAGDETRFKTGKETVINAIIGLVIVILAFTIVNVIQEVITNINI